MWRDSVDGFYDRVAEHTGMTSTEAHELAGLVLREIGKQLTAAQAGALADELPPKLARALREGEHGHTRGLHALEVAVAREEDVRFPVAAEHVLAVCQVLAWGLRPEALRAVRLALPEDLAALLVHLPPTGAPERVHLDRTRRTLAEGEAGSTRPLYRSAPDRAHTQSVVRAENPHADTKLSSATGLTQERESESIATARPSRRQRT